jgi:SAM-dependent methyltransferase
MPGPSEIRVAGGWLARRARERAEGILQAGAVRAAGVPPRRLRARTGAPGIRDFADGGLQAATELQAALPGGGSFADYARILDFGCGSARVLPHVADFAGPGAGDHSRGYHGCDVDAEAIAWATRAHPRLRFAASQALPPLPYADTSFDLIYSISVFSHLDEPRQDAWLAELRRVLAPGGVALLSTHGPSALDAFRDGSVRTAWCAPEAFARGPLGGDEIAFVPYLRSRFNDGELRDVGDGYGLTFHGEEYLREHWGAWLAVERVLPQAITGWQDLVVCSRA